MDEDINSEFLKLPSVYIAYIGITDKEANGNEEKLDVPVYQTFDRERLISSFSLLVRGEKNKLVIMGTAIALS